MNCSESEVRSEIRSGLPRTYKTYVRTNGEGLSPTRDIPSSVTRTRTYGFAEVNR